MKVSVIIPFWKYKSYLEDCLRSLDLSEYKDFETVLVMDCVQEEIDDLIAKYRDRIHLKVVNSKGRGVAAARNTGMKEASGEYVYFLDSDDYILTDSISSFISVMEENPDKDVYIGNKTSTWYKRINYMDLKYENLMAKKESRQARVVRRAERYINRQLTDDLQAEAILRLFHNSAHIFSVSALGHLYRRSTLLDNQILFEEGLQNYIDPIFLVRFLQLSPSFACSVDSYYIKRKHNDPYNYSALDQAKGEENIENRIKAYELCVEAASGSRALDYSVKYLMCKFIVRSFAKKARRMKDDAWRTIFFDKLHPLVLQIDESYYSNMSDYSKKCIQFIKDNNVKGLIKHVGRRMAKKRIKRVIKRRSFNEIYKAFYVHKYMKQPIKENVILFESFFGKSYSDSPKYIYEYIAKNYPGEYEFVWVLKDKKTKLPFGGKKVKRFSFEYSKYLATAKYLVFNGRQPLWFRKREGQVFLETWHGTPLKKLVFDQEEVLSASPRYKINVYKQREQWDYLVSANSFSTETFKRCFMYDGKMLDYGYPRNDILYRPDKDEFARNLKKKLGIPEDKKTILYAPTWRDDESYGAGQYKFTLALDLERLRREFSDEYVVLLRTHYFIADKIDVTGMEDFVYNLSDYNDIAEIYLISDICITDYSSVFFDYANLRRPILFYTYDLDKYRDQLRGFYISIEDDVPGPLLLTNDDVVAAIKNIDQITEEYKEKYDVFYNRFCDYDDGNASKRIVEEVFGKK